MFTDEACAQMTLAKFHCYDAHTPFGTSKKVHLSRGSIITAVKPSAAVLWRTARFLLSLLLILFWSQTRFIYPTEDGSTEALLQILYGQYLILGVFGSCIF